MADIKIKLVKSITGRHRDHIATAKSLGLTKIGKIVTQPDNVQTKGKLDKIGYLVEIVK
jgi:large subunit ribosomal protein L30